MKLKVIKNAEDHAAALNRLAELMDIDPPPDTPEADELGVLAVLIEDYESKIVPEAPVDPIDAIEFRMDQMGLRKKDLVPYLGSMSRVSEILSGKRSLTLSMIRSLSDGLGIPVESLIGTSRAAEGEPAVDEFTYDRLPINEMIAREVLGPIDSDLLKSPTYVRDLVHAYFSEIDDVQEAGAFFRTPLHRRGKKGTDLYALQTWRAAVIRGARSLNLTRRFAPRVVDEPWVRKLVGLSVLPDGPRLARDFLHHHGIAMVIEPPFKKTQLDGAAILDGERPIIALTLRHDRVDSFWHVLVHELAHVHLHLRAESPFIVDDLDVPAPADSIETEADAWARNALIPDETWQRQADRPMKTAQQVEKVAYELGVAPAIVAGRIRFERSNYRVLGGLLGNGTVRSLFESS